MIWHEWQVHCEKHGIYTDAALLYHAITEARNDLSTKLDHIKEKLNTMSQQADTLVSTFGDLVALFGTFATDTTTALADIAAKQGDPADTAKIQSVIDGANKLKDAVTSLDLQVKAADPGTAAPTA